MTRHRDCEIPMVNLSSFFYALQLGYLAAISEDDPAIVNFGVICIYRSLCLGLHCISSLHEDIC